MGRDGWVCTELSLGLEIQLKIISKVAALSEDHTVLEGAVSVVPQRWVVPSWGYALFLSQAPWVSEMAPGKRKLTFTKSI